VVRNSFLLEISVETVEAAAAAERGGADRIELCSDLRVGGLSPSVDLMGAVREAVRLPIFAMIRPRGGDFVYSEAEFIAMRRDIEAARQQHMDGVVLGILEKDRRVDVARTQKLVDLARPLPVTFHRAFDETSDLSEALEDVIRTGSNRILTAGGAGIASENLLMLSKLVAAARERVVIVPGSGINASNIAVIVQKTRACEFHSGLGTRIPYGSDNGVLFEQEVRKMADILARQP
jgi:copper homeostasis protein